ncbi:Hypothetical_protein [Hexamita inflata]|uniref:Hypothetical_protein n=1 Tax=Hexamita inflata TaxID=28002 RepID=A0AA86PSD1_9EUKA|nr:Hypothetical protein HINF_LOCUS33080 [Hexamita inflata]
MTNSSPNELNEAYLAKYSSNKYKDSDFQLVIRTSPKFKIVKRIIHEITPKQWEDRISTEIKLSSHEQQLNRRLQTPVKADTIYRRSRSLNRQDIYAYKPQIVELPKLKGNKSK